MPSSSKKSSPERTGAANDRQAKIQAASKGSGGRGVNAFVVAGLVAVLAIALVVGGVIWSSLQGRQQDQTTPASVEKGAPFNPYPDVTPVKGAPTVDLYEDFRCPVCATLEKAFGSTIDELAAKGEITLRVHLKTVIDAVAGGDTSALAGSAALCGADQGAWSAVHEALFAAQPPEPQPFTQEALKSAGEQAGLSGEKLSAYQTCVEDKPYVDYVRSVDDASAKEGITGTPVVVVNGTRLNWGSFADQSGQPDAKAFGEVLRSGEVPKDKVAQQ